MNYLLTVALAGLLWVVTAVFAGQQMGDAVVLQERTPAEFVATYQGVMAAAAALGLADCLYWYFYGSRGSVAGRLAAARRTWVLLFVAQVVIAAAALVTLALLFRAESLTAGTFAEMLVLLMLQTALLFWACSLFLSPRAVEYVPWGKR